VCTRVIADPVFLARCKHAVCIPCMQAAAIDFVTSAEAKGLQGMFWLKCPCCKVEHYMNDVLTFGERRAPRVEESDAHQQWSVWMDSRCMCLHHGRVRMALACAQHVDAARSREAHSLEIPLCNWEGPLRKYTEHVRQCSSERRLQHKLYLSQNGLVRGDGSLVSPDARCGQTINAVHGLDGVFNPTKDSRPEWDEGYRILRIVEPIPHIRWDRPRGPFSVLEFAQGARICVIFDDIGGCSYGIRDTDGRQGWFPLCCTQPVEHVPREFPPSFKPLGVAHETAEYAYAPREPPAQVQASEDVRSVFHAFTLESALRFNKRALYGGSCFSCVHIPQLHSSVSTLARVFRVKCRLGACTRAGRCQMPDVHGEPGLPP
jgi:hypothetical protein